MLGADGTADTATVSQGGGGGGGGVAYCTRPGYTGTKVDLLDDRWPRQRRSDGEHGTGTGQKGENCTGTGHMSEGAKKEIACVF